MAEQELNYEIPENPIYNPIIRALKTSDPVKADTVLNPLIQRLINNIEAVKRENDKKANAEKVHMYNLCLASGLEGSRAFYWKNAFEQVFLDFDIVKIEGTFGENFILSVLPEGFRPITYHAIGITSFEAGEGYFAGVVVITPEGQIILENGSKNASILRGNFSFLTA